MIKFLFCLVSDQENPGFRLKPGMYLHDLNVDWMSHPFVRSQFLISSEAEIAKIVSLA